MFPKPKYLPFVLLPLAVLALYSLSHSSVYLPSQSQSSNLILKPQIGVTRSPPNFTFAIKVLAYNRLPSLSRCLRSLASADYGNDAVDLHIFIDHFRVEEGGSGSVDLEERINGSRRILDFIDGFDWKFGRKMVHYRTGNAGLQAQWLEAWWPVSDDDFAFIVEDDLELSPLYYGFLKVLILNYYYDPENFSPMIYGASLQRPRFVAGKHGNKLQLKSETRIFLYQIVGTWGQLLFPKPWKEFRLWYDAHKTRGIKPILEGMVTNGWYKRMGERIWTPWFIKFIHSHGYYNIYANFLHERALSTSHRDAGVNYGKTAGPDSILLNESSLDFNLWEMPPLRNLKWYDFCFSEVLPRSAVRSIDKIGSVLHSMQKKNIVIFISLYDTSKTIIKNLLCHFQNLGIQNYILVGDDSKFLKDLSRRGHSVVDAGQLVNEIQRYKLAGLPGHNKELIKKVLVKAFLIKSCLEYGFHSWMVDGNVVPVSGFPRIVDLSSDFSFLNGAEVFWVKSSRTAKKIWDDDFIYKMASNAESLQGSPDSGQMHFAYLSSKTLEEMGVKLYRINEMSVEVKMNVAHTNQTSLIGGKVVFWHPKMGLDLIQRRLQDFGLWVIDSDDSCVAVVCHQS